MIDEKLIDALSDSEKEEICNYMRRKRIEQTMAKMRGVKFVDKRNTKTGKLRDYSAE